VLRPYLANRSRAFDAAANRAALLHPRTVKVSTRGRGITAFDGSDPSMFAADLFHASDEGHRVFAEEAAPAFDRACRIAVRRREAAGGSGS
jgi:lysophospholipase L1-like esterase